MQSVELTKKLVRGENAAAALIVAVSAVCFSVLVVFTSANAAFCVVVSVGMFALSFFKLQAGLGILAFAMLLSPEVEIGVTKLRPITIRVEDLLLGVLVLAILGRLAAGKGKLRLRRTVLDVPIAVVVGVNAISTAMGIAWGTASAGSATFYNLKLIEFFLIYFLVVNCVRTEQEVKGLLAVAVVTVGVVAIHAVTQIPSTQVWSVQRLTAPFEGKPEPTTLGGYFSVGGALILGMAIYSKKKAVKVGWGLLFAVVVVPVVYTLSRTSYVTFLATVFAAAIISRRKWLLAGAFFALALSPLYLPEKVLERIAYTFTGWQGYRFDPSTVERILVWKKVGWWLQRRPFLGGGLTAGNVLDSQYARVLIETGGIGLLANVWLLQRAFREGLGLFKESTEWKKAMALGYLAGFVGILIHAMVTITFYIVRIMEPFWLLTGLVVALRQIEKERAPEETAASGPK